MSFSYIFEAFIRLPSQSMGNLDLKSGFFLPGQCSFHRVGILGGVCVKDFPGLNMVFISIQAFFNDFNKILSICYKFLVHYVRYLLIFVGAIIFSILLKFLEECSLAKLLILLGFPGKGSCHLRIAQCCVFPVTIPFCPHILTVLVMISSVK